MSPSSYAALGNPDSAPFKTLPKCGPIIKTPPKEEIQAAFSADLETAIKPRKKDAALLSSDWKIPASRTNSAFRFRWPWRHTRDSLICLYPTKTSKKPAAQATKQNETSFGSKSKTQKHTPKNNDLLISKRPAWKITSVPQLTFIHIGYPKNLKYFDPNQGEFDASGYDTIGQLHQTRPSLSYGYDLGDWMPGR